MASRDAVTGACADCGPRHARIFKQCRVYISGYFVGREIHSPLWRIPLLGTSEFFFTSAWTIRPVSPRVDA
jgi:hypothetical protein